MHAFPNTWKPIGDTWHRALKAEEEAAHTLAKVLLARLVLDPTIARQIAIATRPFHSSQTVKMLFKLGHSQALAA